MTDDDLVRQAIARGWCHPKNSSKEMDPDLADAIAAEVRATKPYRAPREWWAWQDGEGLWHMAEMQVAGAIHVREVTDA